MAGREPSLAEIIDRAITSRLNDLFTPMPAIVQTFYPATVGQAAAVDALPVVQRALPVDDDGTLEPEPLPVVPNVPLVYPRGGGCAITWPLVPGDTVLLVPLFLAITQWRLTGLPINAPVTDQGLHHLGNCVAIAGLVADLGPPVVAPPGILTIDAGVLGTVVVSGAHVALGAASAADYAALASKVDAELTAIATASAGWGGSPYSPSGSVASSKVKVDS